MNENQTEQNKLNELRERLEELSFKENDVTDDVPKILECFSYLLRSLYSH